MNFIASLFFHYGLANKNQTLNLNHDDANTTLTRDKIMPARGKIISLVQGNFHFRLSFSFVNTL